MKEKRTARDSAPSKGLVLGLALAVIGAMVGAAEILKIEEELGAAAEYAGNDAFYSIKG